MKITISDPEDKLTNDNINEVERQIRCQLPQQYKDFLLQFNGGIPKPACFRIHWSCQIWSDYWKADIIDYFLSIYDGESANFIDYYKTFKNRIPVDTIAIASDPGSNLILLGTGSYNKGKVFFWIHDSEEKYKATDANDLGFIANSFNEFLDNLYEE